MNPDDRFNRRQRAIDTTWQCVCLINSLTNDMEREETSPESLVLVGLAIEIAHGLHKKLYDETYAENGEWLDFCQVGPLSGALWATLAAVTDAHRRMQEATSASEKDQAFHQRGWLQDAALIIAKSMRSGMVAAIDANPDGLPPDNGGAA